MSLQRTFMEVLVDDNGEFQVVFKKEFIEEFYTNVEDINKYIDYDMFNNFKNMLVDVFKKGDKLQKQIELGKEKNND
jgi:hypothetical protein